MHSAIGHTNDWPLIGYFYHIPLVLLELPLLSLAPVLRTVVPYDTIRYDTIP